MGRPRVRISTLMLVTIIVALSIALVIEHRRCTELSARTSGAINIVVKSKLDAWYEAMALQKYATQAKSYDQNPVAFANMIRTIANNELKSVHEDAVAADLAAIAVGALQPIDILYVLDRYRFYRRDQKLPRDKAVAAVRSDLALDAGSGPAPAKK